MINGGYITLKLSFKNMKNIITDEYVAYFIEKIKNNEIELISSSLLKKISQRNY